MKKVLIRYLPFVLVSIAAIGFATYYLIYVYQKTYEYAQDFLVYQGNSLRKSFDGWFKERQADVNFVLTTKELKNFLFSFDEKTRFNNEISLRKIIGQIAKSHNYKNFWVYNQNGEQIFCFDSSFEFPKTLLCGKNIQNIFYKPKLGDNKYFIELTLKDKSKVTILLVINKIFENYDTTKYFCIISAFDFSDVFSEFIPTIWSKFELVEYTFSCVFDKNTFILWNYPKFLDSILILPEKNEYTFSLANTGRPVFYEAISFLSNEKTIGYGGKFPQANLFYGIKILKSKINSQFYVLAFIIGIAGIFLVFAIVLGVKSIRETERRKRLLIERDYLHQLYKATRKYELFTQNANDMVIVCDESNNILEVNSKTLEILNYTEIELKTKSIYEIVHPDDIDKLMYFDPKKEENLEIRFLDSNGKEIYCSLSMSKIEFESQKYMFFIIKDVTELIKQIEKTNRLNRLLTVSRMINEIILKRFELGEIFERACEISVMVGGFHSAVFLKYLKEYDEFIMFSKFGHDFSDIIGEEIPSKHLIEKFPFLKKCIEKKDIAVINNFNLQENPTQEMLQIMRTGISSVLGLPVIHQNELFGIFLMFSRVGDIIQEESFLVFEEMRNDISYAIGDYYRDLKLTESEFKKNLFFDRSPNGFAIVDLYGKLESANSFFQKIFKLPFEELYKKTVYDLFPDYKDDFERMLGVLYKGGTEKLEISIDCLDGKRWLLVVGEFIQEYNFYLLVFSDITDLKNYQFQLEQQKERAEELERLKSHILQNISHEFRTPLNGILGFSRLLKNLREESEINDIADLIYSSGYRLYKILESLIYTSQLVSGVIKPRKELVDLGEFLNDLVNEIKFLTKDKKIELKLDVNCEECLFLTDRELLSIVLYSLIDNAVKFTHEGEVLVELKEFQNNGKKQYIFVVKDTGIGIKPEVKQQIFDLFRQGSEGLSREYEGLGVGLFNAKKLIDLLGGTLEFESEIGKGTTFYIRL